MIDNNIFFIDEGNLCQEVYGEGFRHVLSDIYAHTSNTVISATLAHLLLYE